jgi:RimJ/RimL family protein N-acetyltransferase
MTFKRTYDYDLIGAIMRNLKLYDAGADDFSPSREQFEPREESAIIYVLVKDSDEILGLFILAPQNTITYEVHTRLLPKSWGNLAKTAALGLIDWAWGNTPALRLVTMVPSYNRLAVRFAERAGMREYGRNENSWQKGGRLWDQVLLGISKPVL